ncbi:MAG TPA: cbb3-type cytochrome oxidase assembly protein CcoS [Steroidobacteraceae bacterium]|nr:cbb3-type cytochrome oxidase assembly protein CcoS [Steroidobacteraceae bacterium]
MSVVYLLIPLGLGLLALSVWAYFWAVRSGQFDDLDSPGVQILLDDDRAPPPATPAAPESRDA